MTLAAVLLAAAVGAAPASTPPPPPLDAPFQVDGDGIALALDGALGDAVRGRAIVADRQLGLCLLCHAAPIPEQRFQGNLGPDLAGSGARWTAAQLRLRLADGGRLNPASIMPAYYKTTGLTGVAPAFKGKTLLTAQQLEDVVVYLQTLTDAPQGGLP